MTLAEVAAQTGGWVAPETAATEISGLASLSDANPGDLAFFGNQKYVNALRKSRATAALVPHGFGEEVPPIRIWVDDPGVSFAKLQPVFAPPVIDFPSGVHSTAVIGDGAEIGEGVFIGPFVVIEPGASIGARTIIEAHSYVGHGARIGEDCRLRPHVTICERCVLANRVILHSGVVVGSDGFGYEFRGGSHLKIPQTGIVQIENDVEIGSNSTVDRARFGRTWIRKGTKIDNLVQIAHNVTIGENSILCAQVGISGSTRIGNFVTLGGKAGINGHIEIGDGAMVTGMAGVNKSVPSRQIVTGAPAREVKAYQGTLFLMKKLPLLFERVKKLEEEASRES